MKQNLLTKIPIKKPQYLGTIVLLLISSFGFANTAKAVAGKAPVASVKEAAAIIVKGKVTDAGTGESLVGVSVIVKGTQNGTVTDANGNYSISADPNATITFSYIGYESFDGAVGGKTTLNVKLTSINKSLSEVVVVAYGTQKKISVTGAVDQVKGSTAVDGRPVQGVTQLLQGESPNLIIQQRGFTPNAGSYNINIRGTGTTGNNTPLYVVDGITVSSIDYLNPNDIETISVLKDAGSAAIYGSRSANGVILITTKKGKSGSKPQVVLNNIFSEQHAIQQFQPDPEWLNATKKNLSLENSGKPDAYTAAQIATFKTTPDGDWRLSTLLHDAPQVNENVAISGGSPTNTYLMSFGYFNQQSMYTKSLLDGAYGIKRYNFRINQTATLGVFTTAWNLSYTKTQINEPQTDVTGDVMRSPLSDSFQDAQGRYLGNGFVVGSGGGNGLDLLRNGGYTFTNNDLINGSFTVGFAITPELKIRAVFGGTVNANTSLYREVDLKYYPTGESNPNKRVFNKNSKTLFTNTQLIAEYTKSFGKSDLSILVGAANESNITERNGVRKSLTDSLLGIPTTGTTVDAALTESNNNGSYNSITDRSESSLNSYFGRATYSYANKYFLEGSFRADASSNFPANKRWGYFPSVGATWRLTEENFMSNFKEKVGDIRIRSTYGILGNQNVNPYQYISTYSTNTNVYGFNNGAVAGATRNLANPDITWEKSATFDLGANGTFWRGKVNVDFDYYSKTTSDILQSRADVPSLFGSGLPTFNVAKVQVKGWEFKVTYNIRSENWSNSFTASLSDNLSKLLAYSYGQTQNVFQREEFDFVHRVGYPLTVYQGYKFAGIYQTAADAASYPKFAANTVGPGDVKFVDENGDGKIDANDKVVLGNPFPRYTFGFTYNVKYKNFDASIFIQGVGKRDELSRGELIEAYHFGNYGGTSYNTDPETNYWTPQNGSNRWPKLSEIGSTSTTNNFRTGSSMLLFNMAYARLKNLQVGYSIPTGITSKIGIQRARIYFTGQNLLTYIPGELKWADPESTEFGNNLDNTSGAFTPRSYPTPRFYGAGLDLTF